MTVDAPRRPIIETRNLSMVFGGLVALDEVNFTVEEGSITALIGPNGAGKTTFFNCLTGLYAPTRGSIVFTPPQGREGLGESRLKSALRRALSLAPSSAQAGDAQEGRRVRLRGLRPDRVTALGLARTFQNIRLFNNLTVLENVLIGCHCRMKAGVFGALLRDRKTMAEERAMAEFSYRLLETYGLAGAANDLAKNLPYGDQRRLEIVRALATRPALLLLDEPAAGLNISETRELEKLIQKIRAREKLSVLLIEHDMSLVMSISEKIYVMEYGRLIAQGTAEEIRRDPGVVKAYLGEE
ncbi:MAG: ABC transporter ATP-binding protein [Candidatus Adiutrix sp.]|jgi:branched-chain amino acid transport system ATP-binding protein|nr:ABC transporter ATP-binding protein [Candidatus Adiutrix sp.]